MAKATEMNETIAWDLAKNRFEEIEGYAPDINNRTHELMVSCLQEGIIEGANLQAKSMYSSEDLILLLNFVSKEYNIANGIGWFHTHESIEDVPSKKVLDAWVKQLKKK
jgi:hypothetical protein